MCNLGGMKTRALAPTLAALLLAASRAAAHGPGDGVLHPHVHPHSEEGAAAWGVLLVVAALAGAVGLLVRAILKRR